MTIYKDTQARRGSLVYTRGAEKKEERREEGRCLGAPLLQNPRGAVMREQAPRKFLVFFLGHEAVTCSRSRGESPTGMGGATQKGKRGGRDYELVKHLLQKERKVLSQDRPALEAGRCCSFLPAPLPMTHHTGSQVGKGMLGVSPAAEAGALS